MSWAEANSIMTTSNVVISLTFTATPLSSEILHVPRATMAGGSVKFNFVILLYLLTIQVSAICILG